jgi:hypothetical protein
MDLPTERGIGRMNQPKAASCNCPACGSENHEFRSRKKVDREDDHGAGVGTKYRCKVRGHEWRVRLPG